MAKKIENNIILSSDEKIALWAVTKEIEKRRGKKKMLKAPVCEQTFLLTDENAFFLDILSKSHAAEPAAVLNIILDLIRLEMIERKWLEVKK